MQNLKTVPCGNRTNRTFPCKILGWIRGMDTGAVSFTCAFCGPEGALPLVRTVRCIKQPYTSLRWNRDLAPNMHDVSGVQSLVDALVRGASEAGCRKIEWGVNIHVCIRQYRSYAQPVPPMFIC